MLIHYNHCFSIFSVFSFINKNGTLALVRDLVLIILTTLPELLRQMPLSVRVAGGRTCPSARRSSKQSGREKCQGTHTPKHNRSNWISVFSKALKRTPIKSHLIHYYVLQIITSFLEEPRTNLIHFFFSNTNMKRHTNQGKKLHLSVELDSIALECCYQRNCLYHLLTWGKCFLN